MLANADPLPGSWKLISGADTPKPDSLGSGV